MSKVPVWLSKGAEDEHWEASEITCAWAMLDLPNNQADAEDLVSRSSLELPLLVGSLEHPVDVNTVHMPSGMRQLQPSEHIVRRDQNRLDAHVWLILRH